MFYAGWIAPGWGGSTQGSRLGRLSEVLKAGGDEEPKADAADQEVAGLHHPDPSEHLAHVAATERQLDDNRHDLLVEAVAVADLLLRLAHAELWIVRVERSDDDLKAGGDCTGKDHIRLVCIELGQLATSRQ